MKIWIILFLLINKFTQKKREEILENIISKLQHVPEPTQQK